MSNNPQGESIWGNINTCVEIAINIYMIIAKDENGIDHTGIMAHKDSVGKNLSAKAASMAEQDGEWLCFDENIKDVPLYEVLQQKVAICKKMEHHALKQMEEIKRDGKLTLTDYFGECNPPTESKDGPLLDMLKVRNGIFFTSDKENFQFAIHEAIADNYMSPAANVFGIRHGEYLFYDTTTAAIPLNELKNVFDECESLIVSKDSLYATLNQHFSSYMADYNYLLPEEHQIPKVEAPDCLFLRVQLEQAKETVEEYAEVVIETAEMDFNEETDFEIGC